MKMKWIALGMYMFIISQILITKLIHSPIECVLSLFVGMAIGLHCMCGYFVDRDR